MISPLWLFAGAIVGLLIVAVFTPPPRIEEGKPEPGKENKFNTPLGCVHLVTKEVPCA
jgi:hypothetical protein